MIGSERMAGARRLRIGFLAALLAVGLAVAPPAATPALAAGPLRLAADTVYTLDPDAGKVHVSIAVRATNLKPSTATILYYYREVIFALQPEAKAIRATDGSASLGVSTRKRTGYIEATVRLRSNLYYQKTASFTIRYDLVGGAPRSSNPIRVGKAFASFGVWAWGDDGRGTVEVRTPAGFGSTIDGDEMQIVNSTEGQTLMAKPATPETFFAIIDSENRRAYGNTRVSLAGGVEIIVLAWPEDDEWDETVSSTLKTGLPKLQELVGLDWPVTHDLSVRERFTPSLEGYAGVFFTDDQRIDVSEDLDPVTIMHEASHAWLNDSLFVERWIYEGLAEEYAWRTQAAVGGEDGDIPERPDRTDPGFVRLGTWTFPEVIRDQETDDHERYGYDASFWVMHELVQAAGVEQMREAFRAADGDLTAYPGAGTPETVRAIDGWKRLLDLTESLDKPDDPRIAQALEDFVLGSSEQRDLDTRTGARAAYRDLLKTGDGWLPAWYVREPMGDWKFADAEARMEEATAVLGLRDEVDAAATAQGLTPDGALKTAYEGATDGYDDASRLAEAQLAAIAAIADAKVKTDVTPDFVTQLGLDGQDPKAGYETARAAFEGGRLDDAVSAAAAAVTLITTAPATGQQRLVTSIAIGVGVVVLLLIALALLVRRRRRRAGLALAAASASAAPRDPLEPVEPSGTLAADPDATSPPQGEGPSDVEGGPDPDASQA
jgi:LPXTG-motif cell wall-anchored protein